MNPSPTLLQRCALGLWFLGLGALGLLRWWMRYSRWPLAIVLVATLMFGAFGLIAAIARLFDLLYTGGIYG